jgi:hypothetical protein
VNGLTIIDSFMGAPLGASRTEDEDYVITRLSDQAETAIGLA